MESKIPAFWSLPADEVLALLAVTPAGLEETEAARRLALYGLNRLRPVRKATAGRLFLAQFSSPIVLLLLFAAGLSSFLREKTSAAIIFSIVFLSGVLSFYQQYSANSALAKLLALVKTRAAVLRDGAEREVPVEEVVPGDIVILNAGDVVPGDALLLESRDLFVDEATLTGETFPAEKRAGIAPAEAPLNKRTNALFIGTHVVSGTAKAVVVQTGKETEFGRVAGRLQLRPPETAFERGVRRFGYLLLEVTLLLVIAVFAINVYFHRPHYSVCCRGRGGEAGVLPPGEILGGRPL
ncbi:MAG: HAD-IC family P-type ATPase [Bacillota bacterium]